MAESWVVALAWVVAVAVAAASACVAHRRYAAARHAAVAGLVRALAVKDPYTGEHTARVAVYSGWIGEELGWSRRRLARLRQAALLHDVGKLAVPNVLLNKPGGLTEAEFREVQRHAHVCDDILGAVDVLRPLAAAAAGHHRRFDGEGYGAGECSRLSAVVAVADAYDAMTSTRAYRRALPQAVALAELRRRAGTQFDPACVAALLAALARRGEHHGLGHEQTEVVFDTAPPATGLGSAGVGSAGLGSAGAAERAVIASSAHRVRW